LTWGKDKTDEKILAAAREAGVPPPVTVTERPTVDLWNELYWDCFMDLTGTRPVGGSLGFIPWTAIDAWATRYKIIEAFEFQVLCRMVTALDLEYLAHHRRP